MQNKRRVNVFTHIKTHADRAIESTGNFIQYGVDYEEVENGGGSFSTAIIELDDGTVLNSPLCYVQFCSTDQAELKTNLEGCRLIKEAEGLMLGPYICAGGVWSIAWGATRDINGNPITKDTLDITREDAQTLFVSQLAKREKVVSGLVKVALSENQFSALVSFVYNIGAGAFKDSTLLRLLNQGDYIGAAGQFKRWRKAKGKVLDGLVARRKKEELLFLKS